VSKQYHLRVSYINVNRILLISFSFFIVFFFTLAHNFVVARETNGRDFQYNAWQSLTRSEIFLSDVEESDVFISKYQNDAYETNAGSFYWNSGIRLTYLFKIDLLWPEFYKCLDVESSCILPNVREKVENTVPNLQRGAFVPVGRDKNRTDDWINVKSLPGALDNSRIWFFDPFLMTTTTFVGYLAPFDETRETASIKFRDLRFISIASAPNPEFAPSVASICLKLQQRDFDATTGLYRYYWSVPDTLTTTNKRYSSIPDVLDIRSVEAGTCALGENK
jgi:hypothetical protein